MYTDKVRFAIAQVALTLIIPVLASVILGLLLYRILVDFHIHPSLSLSGGADLWPAHAGIRLCGRILQPPVKRCVFGGGICAGEDQRKWLRPGRLLLAGFLMGFAVFVRIFRDPDGRYIIRVYRYRLIKRGKWSRIGWAGVHCGGVGGRLNGIQPGGLRRTIQCWGMNIPSYGRPSTRPVS